MEIEPPLILNVDIAPIPAPAPVDPKPEPRASLLARVGKWFSKVPGAIKGYIVPAELYRSIVTSLGSGSLVGVATSIAESMLNHVHQIVPNPVGAALATALLTLILDLLRRQSQGPTTSPTFGVLNPAESAEVLPVIQSFQATIHVEEPPADSPPENRSS